MEDEPEEPEDPRAYPQIAAQKVDSLVAGEEEAEVAEGDHVEEDVEAQEEEVGEQDIDDEEVEVDPEDITA